MRLSAFLVVLAVAAAPAVADEWRDCRQKAVAAPGTWGCHCFYTAGKKTGDWERARRELAELPHGADDPFWLFTVGRVEDARGGCAASEELFARAAALFAAAGEVQGENYSRSNRLRCLEQHDLAAAREESRKLFALANGTGDAALIGRAALRRVQVALTALALDEAESILAEFPLARLDSVGEAEDLGQEWLAQHGRLELALGRVDAALRDAEARVARGAGKGDPLALARAAFDLAAISTSLPPSPENRAATREAAAAALAAAERSGDLGVLAPALLLSGRLENDSGRLERCILLADRAGDELDAVACRFAAALRAVGTPRQAEQLIAQGLAAAGASADPFVLLQPWDDYLRTLFALRPRREALAAAESLLAQVEKVRAAERRPDRRAQLFGVWRELHGWLAGELLASGDAAEREQAFLLLEAGRARELREALGYQRPPASLAAVAAGLAGDEALLSFHLDDEEDLFGRQRGGSAAFVSTRHATRVVRLPGRGRIDSAIALLLGDLDGRRDSGELPRALGALIFDPLEAALPPATQRLIVIPDGSLFRLPWPLLEDSGGQLLAERFEITLLPAAGLLRRDEAAREGEALVFADPAFAATATATAGRPDLPRLPLARAEGREVWRQLGGEALQDEKATEAGLHAAPLTRYAILHFAAHALLDDEQSERSALLLAPGDDGDGRLEPREIAALPLGGQLVTLAGCRSALGRILGGEGPMSLGRAFLAAGAPAVVGSLWDLRDDEAAAFFGRFYRHLATGEPAAAALRATQNEIAAGGAPAAAWAGVVLLGDGDFRLTPRSPWGYLWRAYRVPLLVLGLATMTAIGLARRRR